MSAKRSRADSTSSPPPPQRSRLGKGLTQLASLPDEIYPVIFASLSTRSLLRLARSSRALYQKVHDYLGYRHHVVVNPLAPAHLVIPVPSRDQEPENPPPMYSPQGSASMHGRLYVPVLSTDPKCYVLTLDTYQWECFPITVMPAPGELLAHASIEFAEDPIQGPLPKRSWGPLSTSVTACASTSALYFYGGVRKPVPTSDFPFYPGSVGSAGTFGSGGTIGSGSAMLTPGESVDGDNNLRLSSDLFRLDVPLAYAKRSHAGGDGTWRLHYLGNAAHSHPVATAHRDVTPSRHVSTSPASSPLFNLHLDAPSPMADIARNAQQYEPRASTGQSSAKTSTDGHSSLNTSAQVTVATSETSVEEERVYHWPEARRDHSFDCVSDDFLVMFGGRSRRGEEHSDAWAYELATGVWTPVNRGSTQPRSQWSHASAVVGTDVYVFGGCQTDSPLIIHDSLSRLSCAGSPTEWSWINFNSPALYEKPKSKKLPALQPVDEDATMDTGSGSDSRPVPPKIKPRNSGGSSGSVLSSNSSRAMQDLQISDEAYRITEGISTTGQSPIERFSASLVSLGSRRLAVVGGLTVEEGVEPSSGVVFDEFCACHISAIDIFDIERNHWTSLRPSPHHLGVATLSAADYLLDSTSVGQPPSHDSSSWSIVVAGRALDLDEYEVAGDDFGLAAASARNSIIVGDDGGSLHNWSTLPAGDENPAQLRRDPQELLELHLRRLKEDEHSEGSRHSHSETAVRYYERDGVTCLASTFSRRTSVNQPNSANASEHRTNHPIGGQTTTDAPAANYPTGVFNTDSGSVSDGGSGRSHVGTRQLIRLIKFS